MTPEQWQKIVDLAEAAAELENDQQVAFLEKACLGDKALQGDVESLLASDGQSEGFIEAPVFRVAAELIAADQTGSMVGEVVGTYKIVDLLGVGGMGEVYLAEDTRLGRKVALKFLPGYLTSDRSRVSRFEREARAASALNHPNILTVYDIGESGGTQFIATEFVEGTTLRQHIESVQMTIGEVLDIAIQVASALGVAHQAGIVHRDIKPENIMLRTDGYIKVLDFGLAKMTGERRLQNSDGHMGAAITSDTGPVMGTPHYMSPEQARGLKVDGRTDIFSLGVVIYEMLTGRKPFDGETPSHVIVAILEKDPHRVSEISPGLPSDLDEIVTRALRKDRLDRYQTAGDLITDLRSIKQRLELDAQPAPDFGKRRPGFAAGELPRDEPAGGPVGAVGGSETNWKALGAKHMISEIRHRRRSLALGALAIVGAAASIIYFSSFERAKAIDSVAILPFTSAATEPDVEYVADGIADDLTNRLSRLPALTVISNRAASRYKAADPQAAGPDIRAIGRELNVQAVVSGSVVQRGDRLYVKAELIDARDNRHLWGQDYDRGSSDIFRIQDEIASGISQRLRVSSSDQRAELTAKRQTESTEAYQAYQRGRFYWNQRTEQGLYKAISFFDQARGIDPNYGLAYAGLADSYQLLAIYGAMSSKDYYPNARAAAERAIAIDDGLAEAHTSLAYVRFSDDWDWAGAEVEFKRAIELNPNYATARQWYGELLGDLGRNEESLAERKRALALDPLSPVIRSELGFSYLESRQYDRAIDEFRKAAELYPDFPLVHNFLSAAYEYSGRYDEALAECRKAIDPDRIANVPQPALASIYARSGRRAEARLLLAQMTNQAKHGYFPPTRIARVYIALGDKERAFEWLEKAYDERDWGLINIKVWPGFDDLRADPRFADLLKRMNLQ